MSFPDLSRELLAAMPSLEGRLSPNAPLSEITWFRAGGPAQLLFTPAHESDLAYFLERLPPDQAVTPIGLGSNLLIRDGGVPGIVIRLGRGFGEVSVVGRERIQAGTATPDVKVARAAADAGIAGLAFYRGIPGSIGGALRMNAGAHGRETKDVLVSARAVDRQGVVREAAAADLRLTYRNCGAPADWIFTRATFYGQPGDPATIQRDMQDVAEYREANQPVRDRTGGSTFKNPPGRSAWRLIDEAGCRGLRIGGAKVSEMHCNFLINDRTATAEDIEALGETVRARVEAKSGILLEWEIKRLGMPLPDRPIGPGLARSTAS